MGCDQLLRIPLEDSRIEPFCFRQTCGGESGIFARDFDPEKIVFWFLSRSIGKKQSLTTANLHFDGRITLEPVAQLPIVGKLVKLSIIRSQIKCGINPAERTTTHDSLQLGAWFGETMLSDGST